VAYTIPSDAHAVGNAGHTTDHNNIADVLTLTANVNVKNTAYGGGAAGNGVADDTTAIQDALTAGAGGVVIVPPGTYLVSQTLQISSDTTLIGAGIGITTIRCKAGSLSSFTRVGSNTGSPLIVNTGSTTASRITITGITFDGNQANAGTLAGYADAPECAPIALWATSLSTVSGCEVINAVGYSIYLNNGCSDCSITGNRVLSGAGSALDTNQQDGIHITGSTQIRVENNDVDTGTGTAGDDGIAVLALSGTVTDVTITGNMVRSAVNGIRLALDGGSIQNVTVSGNTVYAALNGNGFNATSNTTGLLLSDLSVTGNTFRNLGNASTLAYGISVECPFAGVAITGNSIYGLQDAAGATGIWVVNSTGAGTCVDLAVTGNTVTANPGYYGIQVGGVATAAGVSYFAVTGNTCDLSTSTGGNDPVGIGITFGTYGSVTGNTLLGNSDATSDGIYLLGGVTNVAVTGNTARNFGYGLQEGTSTSTPNTNVISGNSFDGCAIPLGLLSAGGGDSLYGNSGVGVGRIQLTSTFTSGTGTSAQNVTGMSCTLEPGAYTIAGFFPLHPAGVTGSTQTLAFTFGGTATAGDIRWTITGANSATTAAGNAITTSSGVSPTMTSTGLVGECAGHIVVSAAGTLQLTVQSTTSGDETTLPVGAYMDIQAVSA